MLQSSACLSIHWADSCLLPHWHPFFQDLPLPVPLLRKPRLLQQQRVAAPGVCPGLRLPPPLNKRDQRCCSAPRRLLPYRPGLRGCPLCLCPWQGDGAPGSWLGDAWPCFPGASDYGSRRRDHPGGGHGEGGGRPCAAPAPGGLEPGSGLWVLWGVPGQLPGPGAVSEGCRGERGRPAGCLQPGRAGELQSIPLHHTAGLPLCNEAMLQVMHGSYGPGTKPPHHLIGLAALLFALCTSLKCSALLCMAVNNQGLQNHGGEQNVALF